ncbi:hypothetical protein HPP92_005900 [Vanilla planifolia]|uniref:Uncharacterized protein n=1 Tax=Vanilla planifolia TaxID=51239 RepID=A0A835VBE4_VANPL|nr:hypothetical protein HPP92_005900 [Vanilla planifolia]
MASAWSWHHQHHCLHLSDSEGLEELSRNLNLLVVDEQLSVVVGLLLAVVEE